LPKSPDIR